jgi:hypothetical protein
LDLINVHHHFLLARSQSVSFLTPNTTTNQILLVYK